MCSGPSLFSVENAIWPDMVDCGMFAVSGTITRKRRIYRMRLVGWQEKKILCKTRKCNSFTEQGENTRICKFNKKKLVIIMQYLSFMFSKNNFWVLNLPSHMVLKNFKKLCLRQFFFILTSHSQERSYKKCKPSQIYHSIIFLKRKKGIRIPKSIWISILL